MPRPFTPHSDIEARSFGHFRRKSLHFWPN
jgi:hypothetical protein